MIYQIYNLEIGFRCWRVLWLSNLLIYPIVSMGFSCHLQPSEAKATGDVSINTGAPLVCCRWACWAMVAMVNGGMRAWHGMAAMVSASPENSLVLL